MRNLHKCVGQRDTGLGESVRNQTRVKTDLSSLKQATRHTAILAIADPGTSHQNNAG